MNKKALFFDVDGTLIDDKTKIIPDSTFRAIKKARELGNLVFINSGRTYCLLEKIGETFEVDGLLCGCGTEIIVDNKRVFEKRIPLQRGNEIKKSILENNISAILEAREKIYMPNRPYDDRYKRWLEKAESDISKECEVVLDGFKTDDYQFDKFILISDKDGINKDLKAFFDTIQDFDIIVRGGGMYEIVPKGYSKGSAVLKVLEMYNIPLQNAYVFGDSMNDLSMFTCGVKHRILPGEHDKNLEEHATFITKNVLDDGILYAMEQCDII